MKIKSNNYLVINKAINSFMVFVLSTFLYSQETKNILEINYIHSINIEGSPSATTVTAFLAADGQNSIYEMDFVNQDNFIDEEDYSEDHSRERKTAYRIRSNSNPKIFKNFNEKSIYSINRIQMKPFLVKDSIALFSWDIKDESKDILGYNCQKAVVNYRGRSYAAYFTLEIPFNVGLWKFEGLPGTILEVKEENDIFSIVANKVSISKKSNSIENPFEGRKVIYWDEFIKEYKKKFEETNGYVGPKGTKVSLPKKNIEVYIEE